MRSARAGTRLSTARQACAPRPASASRGPTDEAPPAPARVDHEERPVHERAQDGRVSDRLERRAVEDDEVRARLPAGGPNRLHALRAQQLGRIGRRAGPW